MHSASVVREVVAAGGELLGGQPDERREGRSPDPSAAVRLLERLEQGQPVQRARRAEDAARRRATTEGTSTVGERLVDEVALRRRSSRAPRRPRRAAADRRTSARAASSAATSVGKVLGHAAHAPAAIGGGSAGLPNCCAVHQPQPERRGRRRTGQPACSSSALAPRGRRCPRRAGRRAAPRSPRRPAGRRCGS